MKHLSWIGIMRLGLVQMTLGSIIVLTTTTLNRVMVVELSMPAMLAGTLFGIYYGTQFLRPRFGHSADGGGRRTPWIIGGVLILALGGISATLSVWLMSLSSALGIAAAIPAFLLIGIGIGSAGTNLLALLAATVAPERKAAAGPLVWIMMVAGLATTGATVGANLDPYTIERLLIITLIVCGIGITLTLLGVWGIERSVLPVQQEVPSTKPPLKHILAEVWADKKARHFAIFVFASMFAYNAQDLILEPYGGHVFGMTPGESTTLGSQQHQGALLGMILVLVSTLVFKGRLAGQPRAWMVGGCIASGLALIGLGIGGQSAGSWPVGLNVMALGVANGSFAVAAIAAMMGLASQGRSQQEGVRMGVFGAAQAIAFGLGAFAGTVAVDVARAIFTNDALAYGTVFIAEGGLFLVSAALAARMALSRAPRTPNVIVAGE